MNGIPHIVGITGGIGAGKSLVAEIFQHLGIPVYNADNRAKWLMVHDKELVEGIHRLFGSEAYLPDGSLNRKHLSATAFGQPELLNQLNQLVHPVTGRDFIHWSEQHGRDGHHVVAKEAAILFESGAYQACDTVVTVYAPQAVRIRRVMDRDGVTQDEVLARIRRQWPEWKKIRRSLYLVVNDGTHPLIPQVMEIVRQIRDTEFREGR